MQFKEYNYYLWQLKLYRDLAKVHAKLNDRETAKLLAIGAFVERFDDLILEVKVVENIHEQKITIIINF